MTNQSKSTFSKKAVTVAAVYGLILLGICLLVNLEQVNHFFGDVFNLLRPIVWGLILSYLVNPLFRLFERRALAKLRYSGLRRSLSLILAYVSFFLLIALILALLLPQLIESLTNFFSKLDGYTDAAIANYNSLVIGLNQRLEASGLHQNLLKPLNSASISISMNTIVENFDEIMAWTEPFLTSDGSFSVVELLSGLFSAIADLIFAFFVSVYLLSTKERRYAQIMKLRHAVFSNATNELITRVCTIANRCFGNFILVKLLELALISITAYLTFLIFGVPYPLLLAVIGGIANVIPFIGPIVGSIPALVIVLLAEPSKALTTILIIFLIQQLDKNLISPRMLDQYQISSLAVLIAITTVGFAFGFAGLLICVPLFATVMALLDDSIQKRLRQKGALAALENYYPADSIVNPSRDAGKTSDTVIKRFERHVMEIRAKQKKGAAITVTERASLKIYHFLIHNRIISELSNESRMKFAAERIEKEAEEEIEQQIKQMQGIDLLEKES